MYCLRSGSCATAPIRSHLPLSCGGRSVGCSSGSESVAIFFFRGRPGRYSRKRNSHRGGNICFLALPPRDLSRGGEDRPSLRPTAKLPSWSEHKLPRADGSQILPPPGGDRPAMTRQRNSHRGANTGFLAHAGSAISPRGDSTVNGPKAKLPSRSEHKRPRADGS